MLHRLRNIQFDHCGQYGFTDANDPCVCLAFLNAFIDEVHPSSVEYCLFHHGCNMGIGVYSTDDLELNYNVGQGISGPGEAQKQHLLY